MKRCLLYLCLVLPMLGGCVSETVKSTSVPTLEAPERLTPEAELLDVGIVILDPGISTVEDEELVYPEVRKAEATFMATELAEVLTEQGGWGAVRVVPDDRQFSDLLVRGTILLSDGESLQLKIRSAMLAAPSGWTSVIRASRVDTPMSRVRGSSKTLLGGLSHDRQRHVGDFRSCPSADRVTIRRVAEMRFARDLRAAPSRIISRRTTPVRSACADCRQKMTRC